MLSTKQTKLMSVPQGRPFQQHGLTLSLALRRRPRELAGAAQRVQSWGCARLCMASFGMTVPVLAVEQLFELPSLGFRVL